VDEAGGRRWWTSGGAVAVAAVEARPTGQPTGRAVHGEWPNQTGEGMLDSAADSLTQ